MDNIKRKDDESFTQYHIRLFENAKDYGLSADDIASILNKEYGSDYSESKWRKDYAQYVRWKDFVLSDNLEQEILDKYEEIQIEAKKETIKKQDQNRELNKTIRNSARFEHLEDKVIQSIEDLNRDYPLEYKSFEGISNNQKEGLAMFSDWHFGMEINNRVNVFNKEVFDERVEKLKNKVIEYGVANSVKKLHIAGLGDQISGLIHVSTRVQSNENLIEQITYVSEVIANILAEFSSQFEEVVYYNVNGNHARIMANRSDVGIKENFENIIPWFLNARLSHIDNLEIINEQDGIVEFKIFDEKLIGVHGDYDNVLNSYAKLSQLLGYVPDYIVSGHIHHHFEKEFGKTTAIVNGSLVGNDDYAMKGRYSATPSQKFLLFDQEEGLECTYQIRFQE